MTTSDTTDPWCDENDTPTAADVLARTLGEFARNEDWTYEATPEGDAAALLEALVREGFRVIRPDPELAARLREWAGPPYCADDESSAEDMRLAADLIDTDTGRTDDA